MLAAKSGGLPGSGRFYPGDTCATYRHPIVPRIEDRRRRRSSVLLFVSFFLEVIKFKRCNRRFVAFCRQVEYEGRIWNWKS